MSPLFLLFISITSCSASSVSLDPKFLQEEFSKSDWYLDLILVGLFCSGICVCYFVIILLLRAAVDCCRKLYYQTTIRGMEEKQAKDSIQINVLTEENDALEKRVQKEQRGHKDERKRKVRLEQKLQIKNREFEAERRKGIELEAEKKILSLALLAAKHREEELQETVESLETEIERKRTPAVVRIQRIGVIQSKMPL